MKIQNLKIIDWKREGSVIRLYLGGAALKEWWGDDWNDIPYEHNAGTVYDEYIKACADIIVEDEFLGDLKITEPCEAFDNSPYSKKDFINRTVPILIISKGEKEIKIFMGDKFSKIPVKAKGFLVFDL